MVRKDICPEPFGEGLKGLASCSIASQNMRCVQLTGSCGVQSLAWKSYTAISRAQVLKYGLVSRKEKNSRSVVFCISKGYEAAEVALRSRLAKLMFHLYMDRLKLYYKAKRKVRFGIVWKVLNTTVVRQCGAMEVASQSCLFGKTTEVLSGTELLARQTGDWRTISTMWQWKSHHYKKAALKVTRTVVRRFSG